MKVYPPDVTRPESVVIHPYAPAAISWWADYAQNGDRLAFDLKAEAERKRMRLGKFGRSSNLVDWQDS